MLMDFTFTTLFFYSYFLFHDLYWDWRNHAESQWKSEEKERFAVDIRNSGSVRFIENFMEKFKQK